MRRHIYTEHQEDGTPQTLCGAPGGLREIPPDEVDRHRFEAICIDCGIAHLEARRPAGIAMTSDTLTLELSVDEAESLVRGVVAAIHEAGDIVEDADLHRWHAIHLRLREMLDGPDTPDTGCEECDGEGCARCTPTREPDAPLTEEDEGGF